MLLRFVVDGVAVVLVVNYDAGVDDVDDFQKINKLWSMCSEVSVSYVLLKILYVNMTAI